MALKENNAALKGNDAPFQQEAVTEKILYSFSLKDSEPRSLRRKYSTQLDKIRATTISQEQKATKEESLGCLAMGIGKRK